MPEITLIFRSSTKERIMKRIVATLLLAMLSVVAFAHSGGTDKNGCHHDHKNGGYHCH